MNPEVKTLWTGALRSGEYKQAHGVLARINTETEEVEGYCCLGVLCDLAVKAGVIDPPVRVNQYGEHDRPRHDRLSYIGHNTAELPVEVRDWAGLDDTSPAVETNPDPEDPDYSLTASLAELNDNGEDFQTIANRIEDKL